MLREFSEIVLDVWGDFAMFTRPEAKVERMTYEVPTPSACRGILNAIYSKPKEFYYEITAIEVMKPIRMISVKKNEVQDAVNPAKLDPVDTSVSHTQRISTYLCDVYYRIYARLVKQDDTNADMDRLMDQFWKRVNRGKCFFQPALGTRECMCWFGPSDTGVKPIDVNKDLGIMLYDVFDITKDNSEKTLDTRRKTKNDCTKISFFNAKMINGRIEVPAWGSSEILTKGV